MANKFFGLFMALLMILSLVIVSCGGDETANVGAGNEGSGGEVVITDNMPSDSGTDTIENPEIVPSTDKPQYGGTITLATNTNWQDFDEVVGSPITFNHPMRLTSQELWIGDWSQGPAGSNDTRSWSRIMLYKTGDLAESWEFDGWDVGKLIFHIRPGCTFALDPSSEASKLVGGREVTAEDVAYTFKLVSSTPSAYIYHASVPMREGTFTAQDKYTLVIEAAPPTSAWILRVLDFIHIVPHEVVEKYGDMSHWQNLVGSGPYMLTDLVDNSVATFTKNENYYAKNPVGPGMGDQLPYATQVKSLVIADTNTWQAAFRTGRIDIYQADWQDGPNFIKSLPDINYHKNDAYGGAGNVAMRTDKEPFNDIRVRKAIFKALDFKKIAEALYGEGARFLAWPIGYSQDYKDAYLDLNDADCPEAVKDVYTYDPEAAKLLLSEAGYPDGFKADIIIMNRTDVLDWFQTMQSYWAQVGIDVTLDPREQGAWYTILQNRDYDSMMWGSGIPISQLHSAGCMSGTTATNPSFINDPKVEEAKAKMLALSVVDDPAADAIHRELMKYVLAQCWVVPMPGGVSYDLSWPWLHNYTLGYNASVGYMNTGNWVTWAWVDQNLKKSMGY